MYVVQWLLVVALVAVSIVSTRRKDEAPPTVRQQTARRSSASHIVYAEATEQQPEAFPFDPNEADSTTLLRLGLSPWQVRSIYRYRARHGRYHTAEDFKRVPNMTGEQWQHLAPHIRIAEKYRLLRDVDSTLRRPAVSFSRTTSSTDISRPSSLDVREAAAPTHRTERDTVQWPYKLAEGTTVDINRADTNLLKKIPQIGTYRARKIVEYRQKLGGYVRAEQAMEACEMPDEVLRWLRVDTLGTRRINVNKASVQQMMRHPYITFYMARSINEYRRKEGRIAGSEVLRTLPEFDADKVLRLQPYIEY